MPRSSAAASDDSLVSQTLDPPLAGRHHGPDKVGQLAPCNY